MSDPNLEADAIANEKARRIVGRVALKKINALVDSWEEEEKAKNRFVRWVLISFCLLAFFAIALPLAFDGHQKVRLLAMTLGAGIILSVAMIIWSHRKRTTKPGVSAKEDARKSAGPLP